MSCPQNRDKNVDYDWRIVGSDRCCEYCGSWHPDEFFDFLVTAANPDVPGHLEHSRKNYKIYIHRPHILNASQGAIKFYKWHLPETIDDAIQVLYREAMEVSFRKMMAKLDRLCLDLGMQ